MKRDSGTVSAAAPPPVSRHRSNICEAVQTEASFVPSLVDLNHAYDEHASEQFTQLKQLRCVTEQCMAELMGHVYDVVSIKDIMFRLEKEFPSALPVTDMLLVSSKLFRASSEMGRLLSCFFGVVFADEQADEHFHFAEIRILQRELRETKQRLREAEEEKLRLQQVLNNVGQVAQDHGKAVELLESHNQALQIQTSALEDQMALLFKQLNSDLAENCKTAYEKVSTEIEVQERLNPSRTTFRQTMDTLSQQIRTSRTLISEVREVLQSCSQSGRTGDAYVSVEPSVRFKLKVLDSNFQQLVSRFSSVKDVVLGTAQELMSALQERKRILYLSFQHIRLYDLQTKKLRTGKAVLTELQDYTYDLMQRVQATFPAGVIASVDRFGRISTQQWHGGYTLAALRQRKAAALRAGQTEGDPTEAAGGPPEALPGLTEAEMMAAESEIAAIEESAALPPAFASSTNAAYASRADASLVPVTDRRGSASTRNADAGNGRQRGGGGGAAADGSNAAPPFTNIQALLDIAKHIEDDIGRLNGALTLEDEISAFLKALTLSVTTTVRQDGSVVDESGAVPDGASTFQKLENNFERALLPTGNLGNATALSSADGATAGDRERRSSRLGGSALDGTDLNASARSPKARDGRLSVDAGEDVPAATREQQAHAQALLARQAQQLQRKQEQLSKLQDDFSSKLGFLRQVYEARITDLEMRETTLKKKFVPSAASAAADAFTTSETPDGGALDEHGNVAGPFGLPSSTAIDAAADAARPSSRGSPQAADARKKGRAGAGAQRDQEFALVRETNAAKGRDDELTRLKAKSDRDELQATRGGWKKSKASVLAERTLREATATEIAKIERKTEERRAKKTAKANESNN